MQSEPNDQELIQLIYKFFKRATILISNTNNRNDEHLLELIENFNIELTDNDLNVHLPQSIDSWFFSVPNKLSLSPLVIETTLDLRNLNKNHWVTLKDDDDNSWTVCKGNKKSEIVLERWLLELDDKSLAFKSHKESSSEDSIEKTRRQIILLIRYLYTLIQISPTNELASTLKESNNGSFLSLSSKVIDGQIPISSKGRIGLSKPIITTYSNVINESNMPSHLEQRKITPVWTKFGLLRISVSYRHDCQFELHYSTDQNSNNMFNNNQQNSLDDSIAQQFANPRSLSVSPRSNAFTASPHEYELLRSKNFTPRPIHPFKVGSIGSNKSVQYQTMNKTASTSSYNTHLKLQPMRHESLPGHFPSTDVQIDTTSVGSNSKYLSSFDRIRRHSSIKSTDTLDHSLKNFRQGRTPSDDLLEFVRFMDEKQDLNFAKKGIESFNGNNYDISNSISKFQRLKESNDLLSDDLSMSVSNDGIATVAPRRKSISHSPFPPSFSPTTQYPSIPSRLSKGNSQVNEITNKSRRDSNEKLKQAYSGTNDELLISNASINATQKHSISPNSLESVSSFISRTRLPFQHSSYFSHPTTSAVPAYAKLHKPLVLSTELLVDEQRTKDDTALNQEHDLHSKYEQSNQDRNLKDDEDDELLFFMSDMNLSKN